MNRKQQLLLIAALSGIGRHAFGIHGYVRSHAYAKLGARAWRSETRREHDDEWCFSLDYVVSEL